MSAAWTPGPWKVGANRYVRPVKIGTSSVARVVELMPEFGDEQKANARLIAASPTMAAYIQRKADEGDAEAAAIMETIHARHAKARGDSA